MSSGNLNFFTRSEPGRSPPQEEEKEQRRRPVRISLALPCSSASWVVFRHPKRPPGTPGNVRLNDA